MVLVARSPSHSAPESGSVEGGDRTRRLLAWYDRHRRRLPWRDGPGRSRDPYRVWLSEVMLQQTTVAAVAPYFAEFVRRWPTVEQLAAAPLDEVLAAWAGLGYYARARNLHRSAAIVAEDRGGRFPETEEELALLPGIGRYTAAAIAAIAFGRPAAALDGNGERVIARLYAVIDPLPQAKPALHRLARALVPDHRPGDFAEALMDLGATVCTPRRPRCVLCPWNEDCAGHRAGIAETLPAKPPKQAKPLRQGVAFWAVSADGCALLRRRPPRGLLGGMAEVPSTEWRREPWDETEAAHHAPIAARWHLLPGRVVHVFTHFRLELTVLAARLPAGSHAGDGYWCPLHRLGVEALPSLMRKVAAHGLRGEAV